MSQTVDGQHKLTSGNLSFSINVTPTGSSVITAPITLSVSGPFQSEGEGKLPDLDLTISGSGQGQKGSFELISSGGKAYVTLDGQSYELPLSTLESQISANANGDKKNSQLLSNLGIDVTDWLSDPKVIGKEAVDGASTTHIHATLSVAGVLKDVDKLLGSVSGSSSLGAGVLPSKLPASDESEIEKELGSPSIDLWTGNSDKIIRRLRISATVPISGSSSSELGGLTSVGIGISYDMSDVNQPQTVTAPTSVQPFAQLETKVKTIEESVVGNIFGSSLLGTSSTASVMGAASSGGSSLGNSSATKKYLACVQNAGSNTSELQKCTTLLSTG